MFLIPETRDLIYAVLQETAPGVPERDGRAEAGRQRRFRSSNAASQVARLGEHLKPLLEAPTLGDLVLATKYPDGDPLDGWAIGLYSGITKTLAGLRHHVTDARGKPFRAGGYRRAERITPEEATSLVNILSSVPESIPDIWRYLAEITR